MMEGYTILSLLLCLSVASAISNVVRLGGVRKQDNLGWGVVEVYRDGEWGTVCGIGWSQEDANVVCKQLGFPDPAAYFFEITVWKFFGPGTGSTLLADVACTGEEASIMDCSAHSTGISPSCTHEKDAEVQCLESDAKRKMEDLEFYEKGDMTEEEKVAAEFEERSNDKMDSDLKKKDVIQALEDLLVYLEDK
ncbi:scavenger receptor cysteine-rich type 1 protein M130 [Strongylocentrotus purpuratus]|uniref:SRCR domain-containing protein n=1 Tax=Strongylocentrotus purpuratus TaxID=7668 RepID=A0A7M7HJ87_STRPU|nr:scavenger receptor cysteine-rich type 1 protein M130 [Strongylocentrotus purpuratus]|eukprot:XP_011669711.1 PREDICTED: scavenger receptor cysteine-rich type 1 protein M130 [Strongylocentrotus purpuratus]